MSLPDSWAKPLGLAGYLSGEIRRPIPRLLTRSDGESLLYVGKINELHGEPEAGKGFLAAQAAGEQVYLDRVALVLDFDCDPDGWAQRLLTTGNETERIARFVRYHAIDEPLPIVREN